MGPLKTLSELLARKIMSQLNVAISDMEDRVSSGAGDPKYTVTSGTCASEWKLVTEGHPTISLVSVTTDQIR